MTDGLILAIDQGTTSTRAIAHDAHLRPIASATRELETTHPQPGWAEQDPEAILDSVIETVGAVLEEVGGAAVIGAVGLDNQGETVVAWDAISGRALAPAILWHCRRSRPIVERLRAAGVEAEIRALTGLPLDPYFSAGKMTWLLEHEPAVRTAAAMGTLRMGTVDAWLTARLDAGRARTDVSTASRTQLLQLGTLAWHVDLLRWFGIDPGVLPSIVRSSGDLGQLGHPRWGSAPLPLRAMACDQQAALVGHAAFEPGAIKATLGTGAFLLANLGVGPRIADDIETSVGWMLADGPATYVLQGGVLTAGTFLGWLRAGLGIVEDASGLDALVGTVEDAGGVRVLPALAGLGAPWWRAETRAVIAGASTATSQAHIARAALDGIAHLAVDVLETMTSHLPQPTGALRVDGGLTGSAYLVQRLADFSGRRIDIASALESTALGIAGLAAIGTGAATTETIAAANPIRASVEPALSAMTRNDERAVWRRFVTNAMEL